MRFLVNLVFLGLGLLVALVLFALFFLLGAVALLRYGWARLTGHPMAAAWPGGFRPDQGWQRYKDQFDSRFRSGAGASAPDSAPPSTLAKPGSLADRAKVAAQVDDVDVKN